MDHNGSPTSRAIDRRHRALVTGAAGFIGGHLATTLLHRGWSVVGVDVLRDSYEIGTKRGLFTSLSRHPEFTAIEADLSTHDPSKLLARARADVVFHLAGQPGVRASWSDGFDRYLTDSVLATQRPLEAARDTRVARFVFASSSSVYGNADDYPCTEITVPRPLSPYGVTKLAAEHTDNAVRPHLQRSDCLAPILLGVQPTAAAGHGTESNHRGGTRRHTVPDVRRRDPGTRLHLCR